MSKHDIRKPIKWPRLYRGHSIGVKSWKCRARRNGHWPATMRAVGLA